MSAELLIRARTLIADPAKWGKGVRAEDRPIDTYCLMDALFAEEGTKCGAVLDACTAIRSAAEIDPEKWPGLAAWNDAPERTHAEVLVALDKAIASAP